MGARDNKFLKKHYLPHVEASRERITTDPRIGSVLDPDTDPLRVLGFLIQFSALGVQMTEPVESWIRRAGERCQQLGMKQMGRALISHAKHEAGHHQMMIADLKIACERWVALGRPPLDPQVLLAQPPTEAMKRYVGIHEDTIASEHPFAQIAIETEIERMSTVLGPALIEGCRRILGEQMLAGMSFIDEHAALDVGHTAMNEAELDKLLATQPELGPMLADTGRRALAIYLDFLGDCVDAGDRLLAETTSRSA